MNPILTFDTTHHALWAEELAREHGITVEPVPAPAAARAKCSLALEVFDEDIPRLRNVFTNAGIVFGVYLASEAL